MNVPKLADFKLLVQKALTYRCPFCDQPKGARCITKSVVGQPRYLKQPHSWRMALAEYRHDGKHIRVTGPACRCGFVPAVRVEPRALRWAQRAVRGQLTLHQRKHENEARRRPKRAELPQTTLDGFILGVDA